MGRNLFKRGADELFKREGTASSMAIYFRASCSSLQQQLRSSDRPRPATDFRSQGDSDSGRPHDDHRSMCPKPDHIHLFTSSCTATLPPTWRRKPWLLQVQLIAASKLTSDTERITPYNAARPAHSKPACPDGLMAWLTRPYVPPCLHRRMRTFVVPRHPYRLLQARCTHQ